MREDDAGVDATIWMASGSEMGESDVQKSNIGELQYTLLIFEQLNPRRLGIILFLRNYKCKAYFS